ncbi:MAG: hypothetical protein ACRC0L_12580, partial [Angustibacter sp.]
MRHAHTARMFVAALATSVRWRRRDCGHRPALRVTAGVAAASMALLPLGGLTAHAYQVPVGAWGGTGAVATGALPAAQAGQASLTATTSGLSSVLNRNFVP